MDFIAVLCKKRQRQANEFYAAKRERSFTERKRRTHRNGFTAFQEDDLAETLMAGCRSYSYGQNNRRRFVAAACCCKVQSIN